MVSMIPGKQLLHNRGVLYALCILALVQIVMYGNVKDFNSIIMLLMVGFLVSFFSKNMVVVLGVSISATYLLNYVPYKMISEGMTDGEDETPDAETDPAADAEHGADAGPVAKKDEKKDEKKGAKKDAVVATDEETESEDNIRAALKEDFTEFQQIQEKILSNMGDIEPLLTKAEKFIEKFESYSSKLQ